MKYAARNATTTASKSETSKDSANQPRPVAGSQLGASFCVYYAGCHRFRTCGMPSNHKPKCADTDVVAEASAAAQVAYTKSLSLAMKPWRVEPARPFPDLPLGKAPGIKGPQAARDRINILRGKEDPTHAVLYGLQHSALSECNDRDTVCLGLQGHEAIVFMAWKNQGRCLQVQLLQRLVAHPPEEFNGRARQPFEVFPFGAIANDDQSLAQATAGLHSQVDTLVRREPANAQEIVLPCLGL